MNLQPTTRVYAPYGITNLLDIELQSVLKIDCNFNTIAIAMFTYCEDLNSRVLSCVFTSILQK